MNKLPEQVAVKKDRWMLLRDIGVLQFKLLVDGLRDLILVPASLIAGIASLATASGGKPGMQFYRLLHFGKQSERWINLFGAEQNSPEPIEPIESFGDGNIDELVRKVETLVVDEYKRGGVTAQAKERLDTIIAAIQKRHRKA
jgi:hypothetical protein